MSRVQEEAEICINSAYAYIRIGNLTKAQELSEKAEKLFPSAKVKRLKKTIARKKKADSSSEERPQTGFKQEHLDAVNQVNNCKTLYEMLQINRYSTDTDIKRAFKRIARTLHPDKNHVLGAKEAFMTVSNAVTLLTKLLNRRIYNSFLDAVGNDSFYGHDANNYPPKWWCDASDRTIEKMEFCLSSGYKCQNADCERQRTNDKQSQQREDESRKRSEEEIRNRREEAQKRKFEEESRKRSEEEARRRSEEAARKQDGEAQRNFEEQSRERSEEATSTTLETLAETIKLIYMPLRHKIVRWVTLFVVSCYYFPLLRQCAFYWPLRLIFWTNVGRIGLLGGLLWLPFTDNIPDAVLIALETLTKTIKLIYMLFRHQTVRWMTLFGVSCYYFPLLRLYAIYWTLKLIFWTKVGRIGLFGGLLLLLFTGNIQGAASTALETFAETIELIYISFRYQIDSWIILFCVSCYYFPLLRHCALWPFRMIFCTRIGRIGLFVVFCGFCIRTICSKLYMDV